MISQPVNLLLVIQTKMDKDRPGFRTARTDSSSILQTFRAQFGLVLLMSSQLNMVLHLSEIFPPYLTCLLQKCVFFYRLKIKLTNLPHADILINFVYTALLSLELSSFANKKNIDNKKHKRD